MALTGGRPRDARLINISIDDLDTSITQPEDSDAYRSKITNAFKYLYSNFTNLNKSEKERLAGLLNIKVNNLRKLDFSMAQSPVFARTKISSLPPPPPVEVVSPPPPPPPVEVVSSPEALANVAVEAAQPDADINDRIRALIGEGAPKIDDFMPVSDTTTESYVDAINQRIDAAQAVHDKYQVPTQSQASDLETAVRESPVANVRPFTAKRMEVGGKRKRRKQTKKKKHKRK